MPEEFEPPTFEEYLKANSFARFRYKWGLVVTGISGFLLFLLIVFVFIYSSELSTDPYTYVAEKLDATCTCVNEDMTYYFDEFGMRYYKGGLGTDYLKDSDVSISDLLENKSIVKKIS